MREEGSEGKFKGFMKRNKKRFIVIGIIVLLLLLALLKLRSCVQSAIPQDMDPMAGMAPPTVMVDRGEVQRLVYATGRVLENNTEEITAEVSDKVTSILVYEGQEVWVGDALYTIDDSEAGLVIRKERLTWQKKEQDLTKQIAALNNHEIYSEIGGVVKSVGVTEGASLALDALIATVSNDDILELPVPLNLTVADMLSRGQSVTVYLKDYHQLIEATVAKIDGRTTAAAEGGVIKMATLLVKNPGALKVDDEARLQIERDGVVYTSIGYSKFKEQEPLLIEAQQIGIIDEIHIKEGDIIIPGSPILTLDKADQDLALQTARLELEQGSIDMALKEKNYAKYFGVAGINGIVSEINLEEGKAPPPGKAAIIISGHGPLKMRLEVDENDIGLVQLGQSADVYAGSFGNQSFPGTVTRVAARGKVDKNDVYFEVDITIDDPGALKPGMTGDADIYTEKKTDVLRLPVNAVSIIDDGIGMVQVVVPPAGAPAEAEGDDLMPPDAASPEAEAMYPDPTGLSPEMTMPVTESREIVIGVEGDDYIEIISGLEEGDAVVISGGDMGYGDPYYGGGMMMF